MSFRINSKEEYQKESLKAELNPQSFWAEIARKFFWFREWNQILKFNFNEGRTNWFLGGKTNISSNCLDRHLEKKSNDVAIIWESNDPKVLNRSITYKELFEQVCQFSNLLLANGIKSGDRVCIYMPMIPDAVVAMLSCARVGAVHCVVFAGFSASALKGRIKDSGAKMLITADYLHRGEKKINLLNIANEAIDGLDVIENVVLFKRSEEKMECVKKTIIWQDEISKYHKENKAAQMESEDPLFILYTSGSTGKPKGVLHTTAGYMVYSAYSFANVFDYQDGDLFFCTADVGWVTGHSYLTYGPLLNGGKILMFEGIPTHPTPSRFWEIIDKHKVNIFYTAPTAIRSLMSAGDKFVDDFDLSSLKVLGTVGEPINEEAYNWYYNKVGKGKCPIVDTWWQTETGGIMISSLANKTTSKPVFAGFPLPGIVPTLLDENGKKITEVGKVGNLCFSHPWPSVIRSVWNDHKKCFDTYFKKFAGYYFSGDGAFFDENGLFRIVGRVDDVINSSGHRLGTAEIENVVNMHVKISESAVIGYPHPIKGEGVLVFAIVKNDIGEVSEEIEQSIKEEIIALVQKEISSIAKPDKIYIIGDLPKTRSGKIMRRILKKLILGENMGDISTLVNPDAVKYLQDIITK
ncbi:MAG: acetyl-CoA synthetase [Lentimonas sp.]|jgi:acetyl-CoA synthetase